MSATLGRRGTGFVKRSGKCRKGLKKVCRKKKGPCVCKTRR